MSLNVLFSVWSGDRDLWPLWSLSECPCLGHLHWMGHVQSKINSLYELHPLHLWPLCLIWESLYFHRNWIMKRSTRRCWNQRSYLTVAECWITSMLTFRTSAFRWARGNNHLKKMFKTKMKGEGQQVWHKLLLSLCRSRQSGRRCRRWESPTALQLWVLASVPSNLPPKNPKPKSSLTTPLTSLSRSLPFVAGRQHLSLWR